MGTTRLSIVKACFIGVGLAPPEAIDLTDEDQIIADSIIDSITLDLQSEGFWFNTETGYKITPTVEDGYVDLPANYLSVITSGASRSDKLIGRGSRLYDPYNHTYNMIDRQREDNTFEEPYIELTIVLELAFDDLPELAKRAIKYTVRREFAQDIEVDEKRWRFQSDEEQRAWAKLRNFDALSKKANKLSNNASINCLLNCMSGTNFEFFPRRPTT